MENIKVYIGVRSQTSNKTNLKLTAHGYSRQRETLRIINRVSYRKELKISMCNYHVNVGNE